MRYYKIIISKPDTGKTIYEISTQNSDGSNNIGAQLIELDFPIYTLDAPIGAAFLKIWGISIQDITSAFNLNGMNIQVFLGMNLGLPLSNPKQQGLVLQGTIFQAYGNWQGTEQNLNFQIMPPFGTSVSPKNFSFNWIKGTVLANAIKTTLSTALPAYKININISNNLILTSTEPGFYQSLTQFAKYIKIVSQNIMKNDLTYQGVRMVIGGNFINIFDGSSKTTPIDISFFDLIGQPIINSLAQIQFRTIMRADINVSDYVKMPTSIATITENSFSNVKNQSVLQGIFQIDSVRHVGNSRGTSGSDWISIFDAHNI